DEGLSLAQRRPRRLNRRLPKRFDDFLPEPPLPLPPGELAFSLNATPSDSDPPPSPPLSLAQTCVRSVQSSLRRIFRTQPNKFGLLRQYYADRPPTHDPEDPCALEPGNSTSPPTHDPEDLSALEPGNSTSETLPVNGGHPDTNPFHPYPNESSFRLGDWYWNHGVQKSKESFKELITIVGDVEFHPGDVRTTNWKVIDRELGRNKFNDEAEHWVDEDGDGDGDDGWRRTPINISVPFHARSQHPGPKIYHAADFYHRSLVSIAREKLANPIHNRFFHYDPYELRWRPPHMDSDVRVYGELFTSDAFLEANRQLQDSPPEPGCDLPRVVAGMMFWSDSTHLTSFGTAKLWPLYVYFGNESKYRRCQPSCNLCAHVAYFQTVPDEFKDFAAQHSGARSPSDAFFTHCHRELFHAQWKVLLDDEFLDAYHHGIVVTCCDGVKRRFYLRIFTYSADYPEKYVAPVSVQR
ncbi:hypothetical protein BV22DRAFT_1026615, partial [Leucogyrophana mollusca]